jgi:hypothetical protein
MNYYEELGLRRDARIEEIRQAYKVLARLLHPDAQPDARLKAMAECQMKRLSEILAVLTDSQKRRQYDESLSESPIATMDWAPPPPVPPASGYQVLQFGLRHGFWILIGLAVVGVGLWCMEHSAPEVAQVAPKQNGDAPNSPAGARAGDEVPPLPSSGNAIKPAAPRAASTAPGEAPHPNTRQAKVGDDEAAAEPNPPEPAGSSPAKALPGPDPIAAAQPPRVAPEAVKVEPPRPVSPPREVSFAGDWFYAPETAGKTDASLYPATYVELILAEENGNLVGNYRAKYRIPDQAISPEVRFRVQGKSPNGKSCKLTWTSDDGAQGEAELTLHSANQMNVTWWTTVFGRRAALSSGMAALIRQQAP